jgi:Tfp pilus assembly protein PilF
MGTPARASRRLAPIILLALVACGGETGSVSQAARSDSALTARTWGLAYLQQNQLPRAEDQFRQVVTLAPDQALGYADLGLVYLREGRYRDAETQLDRAAALDTANADVPLMLAQVYGQTGRRDEARQALERLLRRDSTDVRALYALADLAGRSGDAAGRQRQAELLRRVVARVPANIVSRLTLVDLLLARGATDSAVGQLETLRRQLPQLPREAEAAFQQSLRWARAGRARDAAAAADRFHHAMQVTSAYQVDLQRLGGPRGAVAGYPVLTFNANLAVPTGSARAVARAIRFRDLTDESGLADLPPVGDQPAALAASDYDDDAAEDLYVGGHLLRGSLGRFVETTTAAGTTLGVRATAAAFGDFDNDGHMDLFVATAGRAALFHNLGDGHFQDVAAAAGVADAGPATRALFVDLDHDGDLDLFLATPAGNRAYRNNGDGTFSETAAAIGLAGGGGTRDAAAGDFDGDARTDLVVVGADGRVRLYHNLGQGHYEDATATAGLAGIAHAAAVAVGDYDNDGSLDLFVSSLDGAAGGLYHNRGDGTFAPDRRGAGLRRALSGVAARDAAFFDFDNDGWLDLVVVGQAAVPNRRGVLLFRNDQGKGFEDFSFILPDSLRAGRAAVAADFDQDGDLDLVVVDAAGRPRLLRNDGGNANQYVDVRLVGLRQGSGKNNDFGLGAEIELRAGDLYQLRRVTDRTTHFGLGGRLKADVLRVRWTNGVSQSVYYPGSEQDVREQQLLKGSCPFLYAWDGRGFAFATDVMWNSALGMPLGIMGTASDVASASPRASQQYVQLPTGLLRPRDGRYVLQLTEELWETAYLDRLRLVAVDHPDSVHVYLNQRFVTPGPAALRLYQVARPRPPVAATDERGDDLLPALRAEDDAYAATLQPARYQGITAMHDLVLDFGNLAGMDSVYLFLNGWIYPTDASINFALTQQHTIELVQPFVQVKDAAGRWQTVIEDLGFPAGKRKTVVADLTGKFLSTDRHVRIRTNMEIYWDQAFVAATRSASPVTVTMLSPGAADLHYRGFSREYRKGGRYGPQWFAYDEASTAPRWEPIRGAFTRYGDVLPLLATADDQYAIFGPGDEITLQFDAAAAPPLPPGWTRDFVLYTESWMKDADLNTADGGTVGPLPFHRMTRYPYAAPEAFPGDAAHRRYLERYDTRRQTGRQVGG